MEVLQKISGLGNPVCISLDQSLMTSDTKEDFIEIEAV